MLRKLCLLLYYGFTSRIKSADNPYTLGARLNRLLVPRLFNHCGRNVNIRPRVYFGTGRDISIGDDSMIGESSLIGSGADVHIGNNVLMGPQVLIYTGNHG